MISEDLAKITEPFHEAQIISALSEKICEGKRIPLNPKLHVCTAYPSNKLGYLIERGDGESGSALLDRLHQVLNNRPVEAQLRSSRGIVVGKTAFHSITVAGREFNEKSGECELLLRDSYGKNCKYRENYPFDHIGQCEDGYFRVPDTEFSQILVDLTFFAENCDQP